MQTDTHFFFYKSKLSQWHMVDFYVEGIKFNCAEKFMMSRKALLFNDLDAYKLIMETYHPREHQLIGRKIKNYNQQIWDTYKYEIVYNGNYARFSQNSDQKELLMSTAPLELVERITR
jgi:ribA/ribD-fused uncharacterized protein